MEQSTEGPKNVVVRVDSNREEQTINLRKGGDEGCE